MANSRRLPTERTVGRHVIEMSEKVIEFCREHYLVDFDPVIKTNFIPNRKSKGGTAIVGGLERPWICLALGDITRYPVMGYCEYDNLKDLDSIGSFRTTDWRLHLDALIVHEFSHAVQHFVLTPKHRKSLTSAARKAFKNVKLESQHGELFRLIYKHLREEFINSRISDKNLGKIREDFKKPDRRLATCDSQIEHVSSLIGLIHHDDALGTITVVDFNPKATLYQYVVKSSKGRRWRFSFGVLNDYIPDLEERLGSDKYHEMFADYELRCARIKQGVNNRLRTKSA